MRQERGENPVIWASIVLAKEILLGKPITNAKLEKLLPAKAQAKTKMEGKAIAPFCVFLDLGGAGKEIRRDVGKPAV